MKKLIALALLFSTSVFAAPKYEEFPDDFSNGTIKSLKMQDNENHQGFVLFQCVPEAGLEVMLNLYNEVGIMTDTPVSDDKRVSITHKFDKADKAFTERWAMTGLIDGRAWFTGDYQAFINELVKSSQLNIRLNKKNDVYRFNVEGASKHIPKIVEACEGLVNPGLSHT